MRGLFGVREAHYVEEVPILPTGILLTIKQITRQVLNRSQLAALTLSIVRVMDIEAERPWFSFSHAAKD